MSGLRVTVLLSGSGSNLQAMINARDQGRLDLQLVQVISNRPDAYGLQRASKAGIPTFVLPHEEFPSREAFDQALATRLAEAQPELVVLAGFMRILGPTLVEKLQQRMINLHPSLLPLYRGTNTHIRALEAGDLEHGASLHFVSTELDGGPLISQVRIPIQPGDTAEQLAGRLAPREHDLVVSTLGLFCRGLITCLEQQVFYAGKPLKRSLQLQADGSFLE